MEIYILGFHKGENMSCIQCINYKDNICKIYEEEMSPTAYLGCAYYTIKNDNGEYVMLHDFGIMEDM